MVVWESLRSRKIFVYFQDESNRIRELRFAAEDGQWYEDSSNGIDLLKALGGTSLACAADSAHGGTHGVYSQSTTRGVQEHYQTWAKKWTLRM